MTAFFRAGQTYQANSHADIRFECLVISADPDTGEQVAIGWRFGPPRDGARPVRLADLNAEDLACCNWTEAAEPRSTP